MRLSRLISLTAILWLLGPSGGQACSVPVFRYALERFPADSYHFIVYHRGPLTAQASAAIATLQKFSDDLSSAANFDVKTVDLSASPEVPSKDAAEPDASAKPTWTPAPDAQLPWLAVLLPGVDAAPVWSAPLKLQDLPGLVNSPVRQEVVKRLAGGESAVFLLLESGKKEEDARIAKLLATTLEETRKTLELPPDDGAGDLRSELPLRIAFSVLSIRRDDPQEQFLVKILSAAEERAQGPVVYPVFGRGRILAALTAEDLTAETIEDSVQFLCGPCACTLKGQLPGGDLLLAADWDALLENRMVKEDPPALRSLGALAEAASAAEPASTATAAVPQESHAPGLLSTILATLGALVGLIVIAGAVLWAVLWRKKQM